MVWEGGDEGAQMGGGRDEEEGRRGVGNRGVGEDGKGGSIKL